jgi:Escherichia/Staphylococcus phage prohead protease
MANIDWSEWDGPAAMSAAAKSSDPAAAYRAICAGRKNGDPSKQSSWALPYRKTPGSAPNAAGVRNALSRLPQTQGLVNKAAAQAKLEGLMKQIQAAEKNRSAFEMGTRAYREANPTEIPGTASRVITAPAELRGTYKKNANNKEFYEIEGYATIYERAYKMWDRSGPYMETMSSRSLDISLAGNPDVAFLTNHKGITMARTRVGGGKTPTMTLMSDSTGLHVRAMLNLQRTDVRDLAHAIDDGCVDEMSFAFMIEKSQWDEDFENFTILQADINRGDVSAVNYGANPFTSISARSWLDAMDDMPEVVIAEAVRRAAEQDDNAMLFRDAAVVLSDASRQRYERAAEMQLEAATRAAEAVEDDDFVDVDEPKQRRAQQNEPMSVDAIQRRMRAIDNDWRQKWRELNSGDDN